MKKEKNPYWQIVRGICILVVILIHCPSGASYPIGSSTFTTWMIFRQALNFPVAVFFFMSGYFVNIEKCENNSSKYLLNRGGYLLIPYLLWTLFYSLISIGRSLAAGNNINVLAYLYKALVGGAAAPLYYIVCLFQLTMLTPWMIKEIRKSGAICKLLWIITPMYMAFIYACSIINPNAIFLQGTLKGAIFPSWLLFYFMGLHYKMCPKVFDFVVLKFGRVRYIIIAFLLECIEAIGIVWLELGSSFAGSQFKVSSFLFAICICLYTMKNGAKDTIRRECHNKIFYYIGDRSYGIFYVHCFGLMFATKLSGMIGLENIWVADFLVCFIITAILSVLIVDVVNIVAGMFKMQKTLRWIGF